VLIPAKSAYYLCHVRSFVCPYAHPLVSIRLPLKNLCEIWCWRLSLKSLKKFLFAYENVGHLTQKRKYIVLLPATLNCHKSALIGWDGFSLLVRPCVRPSSCISAAPTGWMSVIWHWVHLWISGEKVHIFLTLGKNLERVMWRPKSLFCCRRHKILESNGIGLLGSPTRYNLRQKATQRRVIPTYVVYPVTRFFSFWTLLLLSWKPTIGFFSSCDHLKLPNFDNDS